VKICKWRERRRPRIEHWRKSPTCRRRIAAGAKEHADARGRSIGSSAKSIEGVVMNKDRIAGAGKEAVGTVKEKTGAALGDKKMEVEGKVKKTEGKVQNAVGGAKDAADETMREPERTEKGRW
jgi:uncharacterized protein YjbJ (UPF0337 family)